MHLGWRSRSRPLSLRWSFAILNLLGLFPGSHYSVFVKVINLTFVGRFKRRVPEAPVVRLPQWRWIQIVNALCDTTLYNHPLSTYNRGLVLES
ncbi:hypothetical protein BDV38DRAFT_241221 [Aspergillus pseudotamarii]|uniref:Uncharacterized protein n=1 Tax=Aspergillus pseudotamarii TaxID=132259 RepID=A0A5N6SYP0_ASPPS|nr:uncharacterized protein BDV38DRAFT_241221 [Aspergillus pseudotamarii]KAE8139798.1 hypothetical protein BDV38DRAFT_241221 [Aspergillus pseudotamarii]